jgi:hypothetical protein
MIDHNRYDYVKVGHYSNVVMELQKERVHRDDDRFLLCSFMEPLIYKLALTHPEWTIVATDSMYNSYNGIWSSYAFDIQEGPEYVGRVRRQGYYEKDFKYEINNNRVSKSRRKSGGMATKDLKKALKSIDEFFASKSHEERRLEALEATSSHTQNTEWRATRLLNETVQRMLLAVSTYLVSNMAEIRPTLESFGAPSNALDALPERLETARGLWQVRDARDAKAGTTVALVGDKYMLIPDNNPEAVQVVSAAQLDPAMSGKIGVLKIFDKDSEAIECVGMRISPTIFYILP